MSSNFTICSERAICRTMVLSVIGLVFGAVSASVAQTITVIKSFSATSAIAYPVGVPTQGRDGLLYGQAVDSSLSNLDFRLNTSGSGVVLHNFNFTTTNVISGLTLAADGNFYGTLPSDGASNNGLLFKLSRGGVFMSLHEFTGGTDGYAPLYPPVQAANGTLYGTTRTTMYSYNPAGVYQVLYSFSTDQAFSLDQLVQDAQGNLDAVSIEGGANNCGSIVKLSTQGKLLSVLSFDCLGQGMDPVGILAASDGNLYGTTSLGGNTRGSGMGTIFRIDAAGTLTTLYTFTGKQGDGAEPVFLTQGTDGLIYGITVSGGAHGYGAIFSLPLSGVPTILYSFRQGDGTLSAGLVQDTNGKFYGFAEQGGAFGFGSFYSFDTGLGPFVALQKYQGKVGSTVQILGQGFTGTKSVSFNGVAASSLTVSSDTYMTAIVPTGASTGSVVVVTPTATLTSNKLFTVNQ